MYLSYKCMPAAFQIRESDVFSISAEERKRFCTHARTDKSG